MATVATRLESARGYSLGAARYESAVVALFGLAAALRFYGLGTYSLWLDELISYSAPLDRLGHLYEGRLHPTEMFLAAVIGRAQIVLGLDGSEAILRFPYAIFGILTVGAVWLLADEMFGRRAAWFAALIACLNPMLIIYSQEFRDYSLFALASCLSAWAVVAAMRTGDPRLWAAFVAAALVDLYTHHLALIAIAAMAAFVAIMVLHEAWQRRFRFDAVIAFGLVGVGYLPCISLLDRFLLRSDAANEHARLPLDWDTFSRVFGTFMGFGAGWQFIVLLVIAVAGLIVAAWRHPRSALFIALYLTVPLLVFATAGGGNRLMYAPAFSSRYTIFLVPVDVVLLGYGAALIAGLVQLRYSAAIVSLAILGVMAPLTTAVYATNPKPNPLDLKSAFALARTAGPNDVLMQASSKRFGPVGWYWMYNPYYLRGWRGHSEILSTDHPFDIKKYADLDGRLWVMITIASDEEHVVRAAAGAAFDTRCHEQVCMLHSAIAKPMPEQFQILLTRFSGFGFDRFAATP